MLGVQALSGITHFGTEHHTCVRKCLDSLAAHQLLIASDVCHSDLGWVNLHLEDVGLAPESLFGLLLA